MKYYVCAHLINVYNNDEHIKGLVMDIPNSYNQLEDEPDNKNPFPKLRYMFAEQLKKGYNVIGYYSDFRPDNIVITGFSPVIIPI